MRAASRPLPHATPTLSPPPCARMPQVEAGMRIASSAVYNAVLMFMLREADGLFKRMLGLDKIEQVGGDGTLQRVAGSLFLCLMYDS